MSSQGSMVVETSGGKIEGILEGNLCTFKGVPYAAPPIGDLRWMPPQPPIPWAGVRDTTQYGPIAPQDNIPIPGLVEEPEPQSEDCLYLNIFSPGLDNRRRPVMIWIHGGAFSMGSGSTQMYTTGTIALNGDIVLVTLNYRLGVLGFLNLNEVTKGRIPSTGNEGLRDQVAALKWIKRNIASFGGDPENVTIFGESAGAMSVGCLLNLPEAGGLFHRAILESPVGEMARPLDMSVNITEEFLRIANVRADDISGLRSLPVNTILRAQRETASKTEQGLAPAIPVADGIVMPRMPLQSMESGLGSRVPVMIGSNLEEDKFFSMMNRKLNRVGEKELRETAAKYVAAGDISPLIDCYRKARTTRGEPVTAFEVFSAINTDVMFRRTAIRIAEAYCKHGIGGYHYLFSWKSPAIAGTLGACHTLEIGFVFGNYAAPFNGSGPEAEKLSREMQDAWTSFARAGNPCCKSLGEWPPYGADRYSMIFDRQTRLEKAVYESERQIWGTIHELDFSNMP